MQGDFDEIHALYKKQKAKLKYLQVHSGHMNLGHIPLHAHSLRSTHKWRYLFSHSEGNERKSAQLADCRDCLCRLSAAHVLAPASQKLSRYDRRRLSNLRDGACNHPGWQIS